MSMLLDFDKLKRVRQLGDKYVARCPVCAKDGRDKKGEHLVIMPDGRYGCVVHPGEAGRKHRKEIFKLAATDEALSHGPVMIRVRPAPEDKPRILGRFGGDGQTLAITPITAVWQLGSEHGAPEGVSAERDVRGEDSDTTTKPAVSGTVTMAIEDGMKGGEPEHLSPPANPAGDDDANACREDAAAGMEPVHCTGRDDLDCVAADLTGRPRIALDLETYGDEEGGGLDPFTGNIRLLTVSRHGGPVWILDLMAIGNDIGPLKAILEQAEIVAHNAKFDLLWLRERCQVDCRKVFCTMTAARLLTAGSGARNRLDDCLERYLGVAPGADHSKSDWGALVLTRDQLDYARRDVAHLHDLAGVLEHQLEIHGLDEVWKLESGLLPCVVDMEFAGIAVDPVKLKAIADRGRATAAETEEQLRLLLAAPKLNVSSPSQLLVALKGSGIEPDSTKEEDLKRADDGRVVPLILRHREALKRAQQAETFRKAIGPDCRIHGRFEPTGTDTGRFSSSHPNLQNIGRGELREAFVPEEGCKFVVADYSQIELRAAAAIAGEEKMIAAYKEGTDLHRLTASLLLDMDLADVGKEQRQLAKSANFGNLYGQGAEGLSRYAASSFGVQLDVEDARKIRARFFDTYGQLRRWHGRCWEAARQQVECVKTRLGRRRLIPPDASDWQRFTALVNTPVQGGTADGLKYAMVLLSERLPAEARIVATVHDEVLVECRQNDAEDVRSLMVDTMREAMETLFPEVPVEVDASIGDSWADK